MNRRLIYIDQNIISFHVEGKVRLTKSPGWVWVYSKEHFAEIQRAAAPDQFLSVLDTIEAKLLHINLDQNWEISGTANLIMEGTAVQHYDTYLENTSPTIPVESLFYPILAWGNGGQNQELFKEIAQRLERYVSSSIQDLPIDCSAMMDSLERLNPNLESMTAEMIEYGNDIFKNREAFGIRNGALGAINGKDQIKGIWKIIQASCPGIGCDQFFGFEPIIDQGKDLQPEYLGILGCCAIMDIIGFHSEKKCRKISSLSNVVSDARHIANGAFCTVILSGDKRLICRAKAIYEYRGIGTVPILFNAKEA